MLPKSFVRWTDSKHLEASSVLFMPYQLASNEIGLATSVTKYVTQLLFKSGIIIASMPAIKPQFCSDKYRSLKGMMRKDRDAMLIAKLI